MKLYLVNLANEEIGEVEIADPINADGFPEYVQLDDGSGRTFKQSPVETPDDPTRYEEIPLSLVTLSKPALGSPPLPVIHTSTGEIVTGPDGKIVSDTTHPAPAVSVDVKMPYIEGGTGVGMTPYPDPESLAEKDAKIRKAERDAQK